MGFELARHLAEKWGVGWHLEQKFQSQLARAQREGHSVILARPLTFMNESGRALGLIREYFQVPADRLLVVVDDADLPFGEIRLRRGGSSGGHHGLESVESHLGSRDYPRLRIGIGRKSPGQRELAGYVLNRFAPEEQAMLGEVLDRAGKQIECWIGSGIQEAMSRFNGSHLRSKEML